MPVLVRFLVRHALIGIGLAVVFVGTLTAFDVFHLRSLFLGSADGILALVVLTLGVGVTFGSVQMGFAVMLMDDDDEPPHGGKRQPVKRLTPIPVRVRSHR